MAKKRDRKYIIVTGGVVSGIGKGTAGASIGKILSPNYKVVPIKYDGYLNLDPDMQNPQEHGEVYVLDEGRVVDMDFGHYERFIGVNCKKEWSIIRGRVYQEINEKERRGEYLGQTIQEVPHAADYVKEKIIAIGEKEDAEIVIVEVGGQPIDVEAYIGIQAVKRLRRNVGRNNILYVHLTKLIYNGGTKEQKTRPAQEDLKILTAFLVTPPDIVIARYDTTPGINPSKLEKISDASDIDIESIILAPDTNNIYQIPLNFYRGDIFDIIEDKLFSNKNSKERKTELRRLEKEMKSWESLVQKIDNPSRKGIKIAICGKYMELPDSYASVREALTHAAANLDVRLTAEEDILWLNARKIVPENIAQHLTGIDGLIVPGGYSDDGVECMISAIKYARENNIPYLGLCYGLQLAVVEFARNVCEMQGAHTVEVDPTTQYPVIVELDSQRAPVKMGGEQRSGGYDSVLKLGTLVQKLYNQGMCRERHRHRREVNPDYHGIIQEKGMVISGTSLDGKLVEFIELPSHPFFVGTQAHNELTSKLEKPNPLFYGFVEAALKHHKA